MSVEDPARLCGVFQQAPSTRIRINPFPAGLLHTLLSFLPYPHEKELQAAQKAYAAKKKAQEQAAQAAIKAAKDKAETEASLRQYEQELPKQTADTANFPSVFAASTALWWFSIVSRSFSFSSAASDSNFSSF